MEELERRLKTIFRRCCCMRNCSKMLVQSKIHLWIILTIFELLLRIHSCYSLDGQQQQPPRFTTQPSSSGSIVSEGRTKILQCHALGYPQPQYRWLKNGLPVGDFSPSQYLRILNTQREDAGSYKCIAKNDAGSIFSEKIDVVVASMGIFNNITEGRLTVVSGHPAIFDLPAIDSTPVPSVMWQTVEGPLNYDIKYAFTKANQLIILSADESDRRAYRARAINTQLGKEENSAFIHLNVSGDPYIEVPPEIIVHPQDMKLKRGEQVAELQCIANARPIHELETLWFKDGIPIENADITHTLNDPWNRSLALLAVNLTHSGEYACQVRLRSGGYKTLTTKAKIEILEPPSFFTQMRQETFGDLGSTVTLPCDIIGDPQPMVTWFRNSEPIDYQVDKFSMSDDNSLHIKRLAIDDSAMFQCLAVNEAGEKSAYTWLRVKRETAKAKWKNLKDTFRKTLQKNPAVTSGSRAHTNKIRWQYFDMMTFIKDTVAADPTEGNLKEPDTAGTEINAIIEDLLSEKDIILLNNTPISSSTEELTLINNNMPSTSNAPTNCFTEAPLRKKKKSAPMNVDAEFLKLEKERMEILKKEVEKREDNADLQFFKSLLPFMEQFNNLEKLEIRGEIQNLILQKLKSKENK